MLPQQIGCVNSYFSTNYKQSIKLKITTGQSIVWYHMVTNASCILVKSIIQYKGLRLGSCNYSMSLNPILKYLRLTDNYYNCNQMRLISLCNLHFFQLPRPVVRARTTTAPIFRTKDTPRHSIRLGLASLPSTNVQPMSVS